MYFTWRWWDSNPRRLRLSDRVTRFRCANTIIYIQGIPGSYGYRSLEIIFYIEDIQALTDIPAKDHIYIYIYIYDIYIGWVEIL